MSQIAGRKLPQNSPGNTDFVFASVENTDHLGNAAMQAMVFGNGNKSHTIITGNIIYFGEAFPGTDENAAGWRVTKQEDLSAGAGTNMVVTHAYLPPAVYRGSFATLVALQAAIAVGAAGNSAYVENLAHTFIWDYMAMVPAWADTGSGDKIPSAPAMYSGFDHVFNKYATLLYA